MGQPSPSALTFDVDQQGPPPSGIGARISVVAAAWHSLKFLMRFLATPGGSPACGCAAPVRRRPQHDSELFGSRFLTNKVLSKATSVQPRILWLQRSRDRHGWKQMRRGCTPVAGQRRTAFQLQDVDKSEGFSQPLIDSRRRRYTSLKLMRAMRLPEGLEIW